MFRFYHPWCRGRVSRNVWYAHSLSLVSVAGKLKFGHLWSQHADSFARSLVANNPQLLQQHQHHQLLMQRRLAQQQQQQQLQQQQQHGLPVSLPNGTQGLNAAQLAAMQANNPGMRPVNLMHLQQQMPHGQPQNMQQQQQLFALQQAHQAQQPQANNGQPGQHTPQRGSAQPPNMHEAQGATPQSQHGPPQSGTPQPPQTSQPPSTQPPQSQGGPQQAQGTPNPQPQQLPHGQQPGQQPGQPGQHPQQGQGPQGQQGQQPVQNQQAMAAQEAQMKAQQHQLMLQQQRLRTQGQSILALHSFAESLSTFQSRGEAVDLNYWQLFVDRFYAPGGVLRQGVWNPQAGSKQFEISTPALARYYLTQFTSGIRQIQMAVEGARERDMPNGGRIVESPRTSFIYWFNNDCQVWLSKSHAVAGLLMSPIAFHPYTAACSLRPAE